MPDNCCIICRPHASMYLRLIFNAPLENISRSFQGPSVSSRAFFFFAFVNLLSRDRLGYVVVSDNLLELDQCLLSTFERPEYPRTRIYWIAEIGQSIDSP